LEKKRFVCSSCGAEFYLQAWKAVCPSCKSAYTLEHVEEPREARRILTAREYASLLLLVYAAYSYFAPREATLLTYLADVVPVYLAYMLPLLVSLFLFLGTDGGVFASIALGAAEILYGLLNLSRLGLFAVPSISLSALWIVGAILFYQHVRGVRRHQEEVKDVRELREYSGWAGD